MIYFTHNLGFSIDLADQRATFEVDLASACISRTVPIVVSLVDGIAYPLDPKTNPVEIKHAADEAKTCTSVLIAMILQINVRLSTTETLGVFLQYSSAHRKTESCRKMIVYSVRLYFTHGVEQIFIMDGAVSFNSSSDLHTFVITGYR